jgi:hypothetical protein
VAEEVAVVIEQPGADETADAIEEIGADGEVLEADAQEEELAEPTQCLRCHRSDRILILYRGGEMCSPCIEAERREVVLAAS